MSKKKFFVPLIAGMTALFMIALGAVAVADTLAADADLVNVGNQTSLALGTVGPGEVVTRDVSFELLCAGKNHVDEGQTVNLTFSLAQSTVPSGGSLTAGNASIGLIPASWADDTTGGGSTNCASPAPTFPDNGNSTVTITAPTTPGGPYTYVAKFNPSESPAQADDSNDITGSAPTATFTLSVSAPSDTEPPVIAAHADVIAEAASAAGAIVSYASPATTDNIDPPGTATCLPASGTQFALGNTTVTCNADDASGNPASATTFVVYVVDTTAPMIAAHGDETAEATSAAGAIVSYTSPATSDAVDGAGTATCAPASGTQFALGNSTVTCNADDASGNPANATTFVVHVVDTTAPVITLADVTAEAMDASGAVVTFTASALDAVDGSVAVACDWDSGETFPLGDTTVTCTATDDNANHASASFTVKVEDTTSPLLIIPGDITAEATGSGGAVVDFTASASDLVDGSITPACLPESGSTFELGTTTVYCSATDATGNEANDSFDVTVVDTTPPALTLPADQILEATGPDGAVATFATSALDAVDGSVTVECDWDSGDTFPLGDTTVTCAATDAHGNEAGGSFQVTVADTTSPVIDPHDDETVEATSSAGAIVNYTSPASSDAVDGAGTVSCSRASGNQFPLGDTTVTCNATDAAGNEAAPTTFVVHIVDTTPPVIASHGDITREATTPAGATVNYTAPATSDAVDGAGTATCSPAPADTFALGDTTVTCNATDAAGNHAIATAFTVHVVDTTPPIVMVPANMTAEATGPSGRVVTFPASATDLVDGSITPTCTPASGSTFSLDTSTIVTCSATDAHGNTASNSFTVTVVDTTPPTLNLPANITTPATGNSKATVSFTATATDLVDGSVPVTCTPASGSEFSVGTTTVNCSATDAHANTASGSFTVNVTYAFTGFVQPVDTLPTLNKAKAGSAIPVKFSLAGNQGLNVFFAGFPTSKTTVCGTTAGEDVIEATATAGGSSLSYDATSDQYNYVWKTDKGWAGTCRTLTVKFADGTVKQADFHFVK
jgi:hypothetical protein